MIHSRCCIAGGGPAGMMLGFLLARAGIDVVVLEKHADFLRDFRGDTIHPSTLELMHELGILDDFLQKPHQEVRELGGRRFAVYPPASSASASVQNTYACSHSYRFSRWFFLEHLTGGAAYWDI